MPNDHRTPLPRNVFGLGQTMQSDRGGAVFAVPSGADGRFAIQEDAEHADKPPPGAASARSSHGNITILSSIYSVKYIFKE